MKVDDHRLIGDDGTRALFVPSPNLSGALAPKYLVMHYTAGSSAKSSIETLINPQAKASAHLVIARDGTITQLVPFDRVAWHAGISRWHDLIGLNRHSIGIELDNAGALDKQGLSWRSWFGRTYPAEEVMVATHKFDTVERGWHTFTEPQLAAAIAAARAIIAQYDLKDVLGHDDIAPERKRDPGPAFPMESFRSSVVGRHEDKMALLRTTGSVNIRVGPGTNFAKVEGDSPLQKGTTVQPTSRDGSWYFVEALKPDGTVQCTGWVHGDFLAAGADV